MKPPRRKRRQAKAPSLVQSREVSRDAALAYQGIVGPLAEMSREIGVRLTQAQVAAASAAARIDNIENGWRLDPDNMCWLPPLQE